MLSRRGSFQRSSGRLAIACRQSAVQDMQGDECLKIPLMGQHAPLEIGHLGRQFRNRPCRRHCLSRPERIGLPSNWNA